MKRRIGEFVYDTDAATLLGTHGPRWVGTSDGGALYIKESLYVTAAGRYFRVSECPKAPGWLGWLSTGGYSSAPEIRPVLDGGIKYARLEFGVDQPVPA